MHRVKLLIILIPFFAIVDSFDPYCNFNETIKVYKPVTKWRWITEKPRGMFKAFKKPKTRLVEYVDQEEHVHWKLVSRCCEGFTMSDLKICEPVCAKGCPEHANCVDPNRCQCDKGYIAEMSATDGTHYCEPQCGDGCPENGRCVAPNECDCERGYRAIQNKCIPHCASGCPFDGVCILPGVCECKGGYHAVAGTCEPLCLGDGGCRNGKCIASDQCECNLGYAKNIVTRICEKIACGDIPGCMEENESSETTTEVADSEEADSDETEEKIFLTTSTDIFDGSNEDGSTTESATKCSPGFLFYNGQCRATVFPSNEVDCRFMPCGKNAICQENGSCACVEGYIWYKMSMMDKAQWESDSKDEDDGEEDSDISSTTTTSFTTTESTEATESFKNQESFCISIVELGRRAAKAEDDDDQSNWSFILLIVVGLTALLAILIFVVFKKMRQQHGELDVEAKNKLCCEYHQKDCKDTPMVY